MEAKHCIMYNTFSFHAIISIATITETETNTIEAVKYGISLEW